MHNKSLANQCSSLNSTAIFEANRLTNERLKITITSPDMCRSLPTTIESRMISTITARVEFAWLGVGSTLSIIMIKRE